MSTKRVVVVTGATGGIGSAVCRTLSREGYAVVAHYRGSHDKARELGESLAQEGHVCHLVNSDLSVDAGVDDLVGYVDDLLAKQSSHSLVALVNNAAKLLGPSFFDATSEQFDEYFRLNAKAPFFLSQQFSLRMPPGASVVNVSSASAHFSSPGDIVYAMTKATVESLTKNMAEAVASRGIRVNAVIPGFTDNGHHAFQDPTVREYMSGFAVLGDISTPETVADAIAFLLSDKAGRTTGSMLDVSGGSTLSARGHRASTVRHLLP